MNDSSVLPARRRVVAGAAWFAPAVALAAAAPAMAASGCPSHTIRTASGYATDITGNNSSGQITSSSQLTVEFGPGSDITRRGWAMFSDVSVSHTLLSYSISLTTPYEVNWDDEAGWTRTVTTTTNPNRWTYTWTATSALVPRTMLSTTPQTATSATTTRSLVLPVFTGSVPQSSLFAYKPIGSQWSGHSHTYPTAYASTYQFASAVCTSGILSYGRTGAITLTHDGQ